MSELLIGIYLGIGLFWAAIIWEVFIGNSKAPVDKDTRLKWDVLRAQFRDPRMRMKICAALTGFLFVVVVAWPAVIVYGLVSKSEH